MARLTLLATLATAGIAQASSGGGTHVRLVHRLWGVGQVEIVEGGHARVLERFAEPQDVQGSETSHDGHFAFVWHRGSRPGLRLTIYDLHVVTKTADFAPGFGGELHFTPSNNVVHWWGCGTNCANFVVYDSHGRRLLDAVTSGVEVSPSRHYIITFPSLVAANEPVVVYDADAGRSVFQTNAALGGTFTVEGLRWDEAHQIIDLRLTDARDTSRRLVIHPDSSARLVGSFPDGLPRRR